MVHDGGVILADAKPENAIVNANKTAATNNLMRFLISVLTSFTPRKGGTLGEAPP